MARARTAWRAWEGAFQWLVAGQPQGTVYWLAGAITGALAMLAALR